MSPLPADDIQNALLLATIHDLGTPHFLAPVITSAAKATNRHLVIVLLSPAFKLKRTDDGVNESETEVTSRTGQWNVVQRLLTFVYVQATKIAQDMDKIFMEVDVLLRSPDEPLLDSLTDRTDVVFRVNGDFLPAAVVKPFNLIKRQWISPAEETTPEFKVEAHTATFPHSYPVVALGGTFDHLHAGHKILLSMAAWIASTKVIVGVTDDALLKNKSNKHVLEDFSTRVERARTFVQLFQSDLKYDFVPIRDVYGPTAWDPNIQALVVSKETLSGASAIAKERASKSLSPLQTFVIDVISSDSQNLDHEDVEMLKQTKMSSTFIRQWIVKNQASDHR